MATPQQQPAPHECCVRVIVLGGQQVGKSAAIVRYTTGRFIEEYADHQASSGWLYTHSAGYNARYHKNIKLELFEQKDVLANYNEHMSELEHSDRRSPLSAKAARDRRADQKARDAKQLVERMGWAHAFVVMYAINDMRSFERARQYLELIAHHCNFGNSPSHGLTSPLERLRSSANTLLEPGNHHHLTTSTFAAQQAHHQHLLSPSPVSMANSSLASSLSPTSGVSLSPGGSLLSTRASPTTLTSIDETAQVDQRRSSSALTTSLPISPSAAGDTCAGVEDASSADTAVAESCAPPARKSALMDISNVPHRPLEISVTNIIGQHYDCCHHANPGGEQREESKCIFDFASCNATALTANAATSATAHKHDASLAGRHWRAPILLIGNKNDIVQRCRPLQPSWDGAEHTSPTIATTSWRQVSMEEGRELARCHSAAFAEMSVANSRHSIESIMNLLITERLNHVLSATAGHARGHHHHYADASAATTTKTTTTTATPVYGTLVQTPVIGETSTLAGGEQRFARVTHVQCSSSCGRLIGQWAASGGSSTIVRSVSMRSSTGHQHQSHTEAVGASGFNSASSILRRGAMRCEPLTAVLMSRSSASVSQGDATKQPQQQHQQRQRRYAALKTSFKKASLAIVSGRALSRATSSNSATSNNAKRPLANRAMTSSFVDVTTRSDTDGKAPSDTGKDASGLSKPAISELTGTQVEDAGERALSSNPAKANYNLPSRFKKAELAARSATGGATKTSKSNSSLASLVVNSGKQLMRGNATLSSMRSKSKYVARRTTVAFERAQSCADDDPLAISNNLSSSDNCTELKGARSSLACTSELRLLVERHMEGQVSRHSTPSCSVSQSMNCSVMSLSLTSTAGGVAGCAMSSDCTASTTTTASTAPAISDSARTSSVSQHSIVAGSVSHAASCTAKRSPFKREKSLMSTVSNDTSITETLSSLDSDESGAARLAAATTHLSALTEDGGNRSRPVKVKSGNQLVRSVQATIAHIKNHGSGGGTSGANKQKHQLRESGYSIKKLQATQVDSANLSHKGAFGRLWRGAFKSSVSSHATPSLSSSSSSATIASFTNKQESSLPHQHHRHTTCTLSRIGTRLIRSAVQQEAIKSERVESKPVVWYCR